jgi:hypothetical protein
MINFRYVACSLCTIFIFTDLHALLLEDLLVLLQKQDDKYVLKCQSMSMKGYSDNKVR